MARIVEILLLSAAFYYGNVLCEDKLIKLSLVFRHGNRLPYEFNYPNNPYKDVQFDLPLQSLTKQGADTARELGTKLREQYDTFLGTYKDADIRGITSNYERSINTLKNMTTTLYPSYEKNIPYRVIESADYIIATFRSCSKILDKNQFVAEDFDDLKIIRIINSFTGRNFTAYSELGALYDYLKVMEEINYPRPSWAELFWNELYYLNMKFLNLLSDKQSNNIAGNLLHKIASESSGIKLKLYPKVNLYSGHDVNIAALLALLGGYNDYYINYCAYLAFEVYQPTEGPHYIKIYFDNNNKNRIPIAIPGCREKCPVSKFLQFVENYFPGDEWCTS